jgi:hypothetical protein
MSELTRRRDTARNAETWLIFLEDVHIGTIGRRAGVPTDAEQWGWRCGFLSGSRRGARAEGRLRTSIRRDLNLKPPGAGAAKLQTLTSPTIAARAPGRHGSGQCGKRAASFRRKPGKAAHGASAVLRLTSRVWIGTSRQPT